MGKFCGDETCKIVGIFLRWKMVSEFGKEYDGLDRGDGLLFLKKLFWSKGELYRKTIDRNIKKPLLKKEQKNTTPCTPPQKKTNIIHEFCHLQNILQNILTS